MLFKFSGFFGLLLSALILSGCDKDPLSQKGKVMLPDTSVEQQNDVIDQQPQTGDKATTSNGNIFQYSPAPYQADQSQESSDKVISIDWDSLIPASHRPDTELIEQYNNDEIDAEDPRIIALTKLMKEMLELAPVNRELEGKMIKIPGFVIPLEDDGEKILEFLLVPYHGACIHVPAPPSNQIIYVRVPGGTTAASKAYDTVWVTGRLTMEQIENDVAESGYVMDATEVESFD